MSDAARVTAARARLRAQISSASDRAKVSILGRYAREQEAVAAGALFILDAHTETSAACDVDDRPWPCPDVIAVLDVYAP